MARRIRLARVALGLTQEEAAARARLNYKYWQDIERGAVDLHVSKLGRIARALRVTSAEFLMPFVGRPPNPKLGRPRSDPPPAKERATSAKSPRKR